MVKDVKNKRTFMMVGTFFLIAVTIACDVSFTPFGPGEDELSAAEIALTSQVDRKSVV